MISRPAQLLMVMCAAIAFAKEPSCDEARARKVAQADARIRSFCGGAKLGCDYKVRAEKRGWLVTASQIHSFDDAGQPRFMPEGAIFASVDERCVVTNVPSHLP